MRDVRHAAICRSQRTPSFATTPRDAAFLASVQAMRLGRGCAAAGSSNRRCVCEPWHGLRHFGVLASYIRPMRRRFFVDSFDLNSATLRGETAERLGRVLRAEPGQLYELSDGHRVWIGRIES